MALENEVNNNGIGKKSLVALGIISTLLGGKANAGDTIRLNFLKKQEEYSGGTFQAKKDNISNLVPSQEGLDRWDFPWSKSLNWTIPGIHAWPFSIEEGSDEIYAMQAKPENSISNTEVFGGMFFIFREPERINEFPIHITTSINYYGNDVLDNKPVVWRQKSIVGDPNEFYPSFDIKDALAYNNSSLVAYDVNQDPLVLNKFFEQGELFMVGDLSVNRWIGDLNEDGIVDALDLPYIAREWMKTGKGLRADISGPKGVPDQVVDMYDFRKFASEYGKQSIGYGESVGIYSPNIKQRLEESVKSFYDPAFAHREREFVIPA